MWPKSSKKLVKDKALVKLQAWHFTSKSSLYGWSRNKWLLLNLNVALDVWFLFMFKNVKMFKYNVFSLCKSQNESTFSEDLSFLNRGSHLNITSKYFSFFNNKPLASWVAHITRDFLHIIPVRIIVPWSKLLSMKELHQIHNFFYKHSVYKHTRFAEI